MKQFLILVLISPLLVNCGGKDTRYHDTELLERPPVLAVNKDIAEPAIEADLSVVPKKTHKNGLGDLVKLQETKPMAVKIQQNYDEAWRTLERALQQADIAVTDHNQRRGLFYVYYAPKSIFSVFASKDKEHHEANFMLTVESEQNAVNVSAIPIKVSGTEETDNNDSTSDQEGLLLDLYGTLHDDFKEE